MFTLSVITINRNNANGLRKTMASVFAQGKTLGKSVCEYIVIDGGSSDCSQEIIRTFANNDSGIRMRWVSEQDTGIYNAMNKGIYLAAGDYCLFLNSGDVLISEDVLWQVKQQMERQVQNVDVYYADAMFADDPGSCRRTYPKQLSLDFFYYDSLCHQAMFYKRDVLLSIGGYDERYRLIADWVMNMQLFRDGYIFCHLPVLTTLYDTGGLTGGKEGYEKCRKERNRYYQTNGLRHIHVCMWIKRKCNQWKRRIKQ